MPHRLVSLTILLAWAVVASSLLVRDVLPDLLAGPPPDLRDLAQAARPPGPTSWTILVDDRPTEPGDGLRAVGRVTTRTLRQVDGHVRFVSDAWVDAGDLLRGSPLAAAESTGDRLQIRSLIDVDASGNLYQLRSAVRAEGDPTELLIIEGHPERDAIAIRAYGPSMLFTWTKRFPYQARGLVQNSLGPIDKLPGLHVGQRWESRIVSPLTGRVEVVRAEVARRNVLIHWGEQPVPCFELVTRANGLTARTWARMTDGLVIRQEVPLLFVRLVLDREPAAAEERPVP